MLRSERQSPQHTRAWSPFVEDLKFAIGDHDDNILDDKLNVATVDIRGFEMDASCVQECRFSVAPRRYLAAMYSAGASES